MPVIAGTENGAELGLEELGMSRAEADAAKAHERVGFLARAEIGDMLVAAEVERANGHGLARGGLDDLAIGGELLLLVGDRRVRQEQILGAVQPDADGAGADQPSGRRRGR